MRLDQQRAVAGNHGQWPGTSVAPGRRRGFAHILALLAFVTILTTHCAKDAVTLGKNVKSWSLSPKLSEIRVGLLAHSIEPRRVGESGVDTNLEILLRQGPHAHDNKFLNGFLRPRHHAGTSINLTGQTSVAYTGWTWTLRNIGRLIVEAQFSGAIHDGPLANPGGQAFGCRLNFRESFSIGYRLSDRWRIYWMISHMSNASLCPRNSGLTNTGLRLGYTYP